MEQLATGYSVLRTPSAALRPWVEMLWFVADDDSTGWELKLPVIGSQLLVNLDTDQLGAWDARTLRSSAASGTAIATATGGASLLDRVQQRRLVGAVLRPGASWAVLGAPAHAISAPQVVPLEDLWPRRAARLRQRCLEATSAGEVLDIFQDELSDQVRRADPAAPFDLSGLRDRLRVGQPIRAVAADCGMSMSTLQRRCYDGFGVAAKRAQRLLRLGKAVEMLNQDIALGQVAAGSGFSDQAHFSHDFADLVGLTPGQYRRMRGVSPFHVEIARDDEFLQDPRRQPVRG